jgi:Uma2 family endonuclease
MAQGKRPATYEDIEALPPGWVGEIVDQELTASPRPAMGATRAASALGGMVGAAFDWGQGARGGWWILFEPELHFGGNVLVPDLAGWRRERMPQPPEPEVPWLSLAPDWVAEVLSPSTARFDRERKLPVYHRERVEHVWLLDPRQRVLEVYRWQEQGWLHASTHGGSQVVRAEPFEALPLQLGGLWWTAAQAVPVMNR